MAREYTPINWEDAPEKSTPLSADNLNHMDTAIAALHSDVADLENSVDSASAKLVSDLIPTETERVESADVYYIASSDYAAGDYLILTDKIYKMLSNVSAGGYIVPAPDDATEESIGETQYSGMTPNAVKSTPAGAMRWWINQSWQYIDTDSEPVENSNKPITSGGVYAALRHERPLWVNFGNVSELPATEVVEGINRDMVCTAYYLSNPTVMLDDWDVLTSDGSVRIVGTIGGATYLKILLEEFTEAGEEDTGVLIGD